MGDCLGNYNEQKSREDMDIGQLNSNNRHGRETMAESQWQKTVRLQKQQIE